MRNTQKAFIWIIKILQENNIRYRISGGLAARIYGCKRRLADIDIEVLEKDIDKVYQHTEKFAVYGPKKYVDDNWKLRLLTLKYKNQEIDIAAFESKIFNHETKKWIERPGVFTDVNIENIFGMSVTVEKIGSLINYKKILAREVDIKDVKNLMRLI